MKFDISAWRAWAPGISTEQEWLQWLNNPLHPVSTETADVSFLPAMQRRRLSPLARMVFHVAWPLAKTQPVVFCSRHGENVRNLELLKQVGEREALSPASFSLSVHNAIIGLWSIFREDRSEMTALAGNQDVLEHGLLEAWMLLEQGAESVLVVMAEDQQPELYQPWITDAPFPYALALEIKAGDGFSLELKTQQSKSAQSPWPHAINVLSLLLGQKNQLLQGVDTRQWLWSVRP